MNSSADELRQKAKGKRQKASVAARFTFYLLPFTFLVLAALYNAVVPLGEGPDESGHINYVLFLAREGRLPVQRAEGKGDVPGEGHQPPLAYALALPAVAWLPAETRSITLTANQSFVWSGGSQPYAFMRGSQELWPWHGVVLAWHIARAISSLCGAATVLCTWSIARRLGYGPTAALLAAGLVAFNPQFLFTSALVTNDALLAALSAGALLITVSNRQSAVANVVGAKQAAGPSSALSPNPALPPASPALNATCAAPRAVRHQVSGITLGLFIGLALLTKQSAIILLVLLPLAAWWRHGRDWRRGLVSVAVSGAVVVLVAGWWYWRNVQLYGDLFGLEAFRAEFITQSWEWRDPAAWGSALVQLHESFWGRFGWMSVRAPGWWNILTVVLVVAVLAGLIRSLISRQSAEERRALFVRYGLLAVLPAVALAWTLSFALTAGLVAWQGRFLFPAIAPIGVLLAAGLGSWGRQGDRETGRQGDRETGRHEVSGSRFLVLGSLFTLGILGPIFLALAVIAPSYPWRVIREDQALATRGEAMYLRFAENWKRGVELRGWQAAGAWQPGSTVGLTLTWHALEPISRNWTVFIHLVDDGDNVVAESNMQPLNGQSPMKLWTPDDWVRDPHTLVLPSNLPPGTYTLRLGLFDANSNKGRRQGVWDASGEFVGDAADVSRIMVTR